MEILRRRVERAVRRACPPWAGDRAEDIVQNVLVRLVASQKKRETDATFSAIYLEKAAHGAFVDEVRRLARRKESGVGDSTALDQEPSPIANPERGAASAEIGAGIQDCLARLLHPRRLAVTLYLQGCPVAEVARRRRWEFKRAHNLVYRGLNDLRACLDGKGLAPS
jgi:RNA polymerase sigma factor (sigma-70 family)